MMFFDRRISRFAQLAATALPLALGLSGCFDLGQSVVIGRDGAGTYKVAVSAKGMVGEALKNGKATVDLDENNRNVKTHVDVHDDLVTQIATVDFKSLSGLHLSDDVMSLHVTGHSFFGLGPAHVTFRRTFLVDNARKSEARDHDMGDDFGKDVLQTMFGDHTYVFAVTVPGSVEAIAPVRVGGHEIRPAVTGDMIHGHTITWRMPLTDMFLARRLTFQVDFSAYGNFADVQTVTGGTRSL